MDVSMDYQKALSYFNERSVLPGVICISVGFLLLFVPVIGIAIGFVLIIIGVIIVAVNASGNITDEMMDRYAYGFFANIANVALNRLGLDPSEVREVYPIFIGGYDYDKYSHVKEGKDGVIRTDVYEMAVIFFTQNEMHMYRIKKSLVSPEVFESTEVFFYRDIVAVSTATGEVKVGGKKKIYQAFQITTSGGKVEPISARDEAEMQRSINGMRNLLRAKKQQMM